MEKKLRDVLMSIISMSNDATSINMELYLRDYKDKFIEVEVEGISVDILRNSMEIKLKELGV